MLEKFFKQNWDQIKFFSLVAAFFIGLDILAVVLTMAGIFYRELLVGYLLVGGFILIKLALRNYTLLKFSRETKWVFIVGAIVVIVFYFFSSPTIFSGRDQGALSLGAIYLADNHQLEVSFPAEQEFFEIYGPGKALNFPGFNYTELGSLKTQFPLGYISWLAVFYSLFGINGLIIANAVTFFLFFISFYFVLKKFISAPARILAMLTLITTFVFYWFFKFTLSENLALFLVWFGIVQLIIYQQKKDNFFLWLSFLSFSVLAFTRIEALAFLAMLFIWLIVKNKFKKEKKNSLEKWQVISLISIGLIYIIALYVNQEFYISLAKSLFKSSTNTTGVVSQNAIFQPFYYVLKVFLAYGMLNFLLFGLLTVAILFKKKDYQKLTPFIILWPVVFYLFSPQISLDHPWMLRRFLLAVIPGVIFYTFYFFDQLIRKRIFLYFFSGLFLVSNLIIAGQFFFFQPENNLKNQMEILFQRFSNNDLILIDRQITGDPWSMMAGPMHALQGKQTVYFFNPSDLDKIDKTKFASIYLISPKEGKEFYENSLIGSKLTQSETLTIKNAIIVTDNLTRGAFISLPKIINQSTEVIIYKIN